MSNYYQSKFDSDDTKSAFDDTKLDLDYEPPSQINKGKKHMPNDDHDSYDKKKDLDFVISKKLK